MNNDQPTLNTIIFAKAVRDDDIHLARQLVRETNTDIDYQLPKNGMSPLMLAVINQNVLMFDMLIENGARCDLVDHNGRTLLMRTAIYAAGELSWSSGFTYRLLAIYPKAINLKDADGYTALMYAAKNEDAAELIPILVNAGASFDLVNLKKETALQLAIRQNLRVNINILFLKQLLKTPREQAGEFIQSYRMAVKWMDLSIKEEIDSVKDVIERLQLVEVALSPSSSLNLYIQTELSQTSRLDLLTFLHATKKKLSENPKCKQFLEEQMKGKPLIFKGPTSQQCSSTEAKQAQPNRPSSKL